jgi:hypothetical protein
MAKDKETTIKTSEENYYPSTAAGTIADVLTLGLAGTAVDAMSNPSGETRYNLEVNDQKESYNSKEERDEAIKKHLDS